MRGVGFTPLHRAGSGSPLVCLHGFTDTWRTWELVLPTLERRHDVLAPTLPGHAGGPPLPSEAGQPAVVDALERIECPVRIAWGTEDKILPWRPPPPATATSSSPTPIGSCSTAWVIAPSSTSRSRPRS